MRTRGTASAQRIRAIQGSRAELGWGLGNAKTRKWWAKSGGKGHTTPCLLHIVALGILGPLGVRFRRMLKIFRKVRWSWDESKKLGAWKCCRPYSELTFPPRGFFAFITQQFVYYIVWQSMKVGFLLGCKDPERHLVFEGHRRGMQW